MTRSDEFRIQHVLRDYERERATSVECALLPLYCADERLSLLEKADQVLNSLTRDQQSIWASAMSDLLQETRLEDPPGISVALGGTSDKGPATFGGHVPLEVLDSIIKRVESGRRGVLTPAPHTTGHTGP